MLEQVLTESPTLEAVAEGVQARVAAATPAVFAALWRHIRDEADAVAHDAERKLEQRGTEEAAALRAILHAQKRAIVQETQRRTQLTLDDQRLDKREQDQFRKEQQFMQDRLTAIDEEAEREPEQIEAMYKVMRPRLEPVGLVFLWPETRG
jgi:hypothetical protein